ncbi:MAG: filamentous hemagglutinin N-terminal domain-containing protein, partial [Alphaproteobacteria bacterium]
MGGINTGTLRGTASPARTDDHRRLARLRSRCRGTTALSTGMLFWGAPLLGAALLGATPAAGNPEGGSVVAGGATIVSAPGDVTVNQSTDRAILHWDSFGIDVGETTTFNQPDSGSIALNRVTGTARSDLMGTLRANGNVWLVNPNGIVAGRGTIIDVNGFLASTADILDRDFMDGDGRFAFDLPSLVSGATVVNQGEISIAQHGLAALVAPGVENAGVITGALGHVVLAGTPTFTIDFAGDGLIHFALTGDVDDLPDGLAALVSNSGEIVVPAGNVLIAASTADGVVDNVINMSGIIQAQTVTTLGGRVLLDGGDTGIVRVSGTIDASGDESGETGGQVQVLGELIALDNGTVIDASGAAGGGEVLVGGDYRGGGGIDTARRVVVTSGASIDVSATEAGDGGRAVVWSDEYTYYAGTIGARGGATTGDGGFVEVSGAQSLAFRGAVDTSASAGAAGTLLLDPLNVIIAAGAGPAPNDDGELTADNQILAGDSPTATFTISENAIEGLS